MLTLTMCATEFSDANAKFYCRIYYAEEFHMMREEVMESSEEDFVHSLSHCVNWQARGGKSGAVFYATEGHKISANEWLHVYCIDSETVSTAALFSVTRAPLQNWLCVEEC